MQTQPFWLAASWTLALLPAFPPLWSDASSASFLFCSCFLLYFFHCFHSLPVLYHFCIVEHIFSFSSILNLPAVILLQLSHQSCLLAMLFCLSILGWGSVTDYNVLSHRKFHYSYTQAIVFCHFPIFSLTPLVRSNH